MKFKICVIGCGWMANKGHGPAFKKYSEENLDVELSACCDMDEDKARNFKENFGFSRCYVNYQEMLELENPDVVSLISPVDKTKELAIDIIKKGYPLILEKPPGRNEREIQELIAAAQENNVLVKVAFNRRYTPLIQQLKGMLKGKGLYHINYNMIRNKRFDQDFSTTCIHAIDTVQFLSGSSYQKIHFTYQDLPEFGESVSNIYLNCTFDNGMIANLNFVVAAGSVVENIFVNSLEETYIINVPFFNSYDYPGRMIGLKSKEKEFEITGDMMMEDFELSGFYNQNKEFFDIVRSGKREYIDDLESSLQPVIIADGIRQRVDKLLF